MKYKTLIFRDDQEDQVHMILLRDDFGPSGMPTICMSEGQYAKSLTRNNFFIAKVDFIPNRRFDGKFEVMSDFDKFDYMVSSESCFEMKDDENDDYTVHQMIRDGKFWIFVNQLVEEYELIEKFEDLDEINELMEKMSKGKGGKKDGI